MNPLHKMSLGGCHSDYHLGKSFRWCQWWKVFHRQGLVKVMSGKWDEATRKLQVKELTKDHRPDNEDEVMPEGS